MMNSIKWKSALLLILIIAAVVSCLNWFFGDRVFSFMFVVDCIGKSVTVITILSSVFCVYFWKYKLFQKWLVLVPNLNGLWKGGIDSDWNDPETGQKRSTIKANLTIKQTLFKISCLLETNESSSYSSIANFVIEPDNQIKRLVYTYQNNPKQTLQEKSRIHYGTVMLDIKVRNKAILLEGNYWTGRNTSGYVAFSSREKLKRKGSHRKQSKN